VVSAGLSLAHEADVLVIAWQGKELFRYVYRPGEPRVESPRPYFHPVRTLGGTLVTEYRPDDHLWHKGISWALSNVGDENFWGGPTFQRGKGYVQLDNNGTQRHLGFNLIGSSGGLIDVDERLDWETQAGEQMFTERRRFSVRTHPDLDAWQLAYWSEMTNISGKKVAFGSPTSRGRPAAGYSGLFWRGPRSFLAAAVVGPQGSGGEESMGARGPWLACAGSGSTVVFRDHVTNFNHPTPWFVRTGEFAGICPAPFYDTDHDVAAGETLSLRYDVLIADGQRDAEGCAALAEVAGRSDLFVP
jgi:hypothetical protein